MSCVCHLCVAKGGVESYIRLEVAELEKSGLDVLQKLRNMSCVCHLGVTKGGHIVTVHIIYGWNMV